MMIRKSSHRNGRGKRGGRGNRGGRYLDEDDMDGDDMDEAELEPEEIKTRRRINGGKHDHLAEPAP